MENRASDDVTAPGQLAEGDTAVASKLVPIVCDELRRFVELRFFGVLTVQTPELPGISPKESNGTGAWPKPGSMET